jgi:hypothetical protein
MHRWFGERQQYQRLAPRYLRQASRSAERSCRVPGPLAQNWLYVLVLAAVTAAVTSTVLGRAEGVKGYHDITRYPDARQIPGLVLFRWDAPLFFANAEFFKERILDAVPNNWCCR